MVYILVSKNFTFLDVVLVGFKGHGESGFGKTGKGDFPFVEKVLRFVLKFLMVFCFGIPFETPENLIGRHHG